MAAFERIPLKWLVVAGSAVGVLIVAVAAIVLLSGPSKPPTLAAPAPGAGSPGGTAPSGPASTAPGSATSPGSGGSPGSTVPGPGAPPAGTQAGPPTSVDALRALLVTPPGTDSTVDTGPIDDTTFEGTRWGVTQFWSNPEGSMVLAQYGTADQAREALTQYRDSINVSGICDERAVSGHADAYLCAAKDLGQGVNPGDIPAIGVGAKGTIVALVTASDPTVVQQLLVKQLDRLP